MSITCCSQLCFKAPSWQGCILHTQQHSRFLDRVMVCLFLFFQASLLSHAHEKRLTASLDFPSSQTIWKKQISHPLEFGNPAGYIIRTVPASQVPWTHFHDIGHFFYAIKWPQHSSLGLRVSGPTLWSSQCIHTTLKPENISREMMDEYFEYSSAAVTPLQRSHWLYFRDFICPPRLPNVCLC